MALPPVIFSALSLAASNPKVQETAERLLTDVYGRFIAPRFGQTKSDLTSSEKVEPATKEEVAASFAVLQAELDNRLQHLAALIGNVQAELKDQQQWSFRWFSAIIAVQVLLFVALILILVG